MKKIPELFLHCCGKIHKPHSIKFLGYCVKITFYCPHCRNWIYLECKNGIKKRLNDTDLDKLDKQTNKHSSFKYVKRSDT